MYKLYINGLVLYNTGINFHVVILSRYKNLIRYITVIQQAPTIYKNSLYKLILKDVIRWQ